MSTESNVVLPMDTVEARALWHAAGMAVGLMDELGEIPPEAPLHGQRDRLADVARRLDHQINHAGAQAPSEAARMLAEFHAHPNALVEGTNTQALRLALHNEEHEELVHELRMAALGEADLHRIARELADVLYVTYGTAWAFGIDLDAALAEVHRAAMDKMRAGLRREDGKILKPPGFRPPDMTAAVAGAAK